MEAFWRFLMYAVFCAIGYYTLFVPTVAPWILDTNQHWDQWPSHQITVSNITSTHHHNHLTLIRIVGTVFSHSVPPPPTPPPTTTTSCNLSQFRSSHHFFFSFSSSFLSIHPIAVDGRILLPRPARLLSSSTTMDRSITK